MPSQFIEKFYPELAKIVREGKCPFCRKEINIKDFKDALSIEEYRISGLCQECQDNFFEEK